MPDSFIEDPSTDAELSKAQTLADTLLESSADGIVVLDRYGVVERLNQLAQIMLGVTSNEPIGKSVNEVFLAFDPETDEPIDLSSEKYRSPHLTSTRAYLLKPDGTRASIAFQLKPKTSADPSRPEH